MDWTSFGGWRGAVAALGVGVAVLGGVACSSSDEGGGASAGCTRDTDCKGDRICVSGQCAAPGAGGTAGSGTGGTGGSGTGGTGGSSTGGTGGSGTGGTGGGAGGLAGAAGSSGGGASGSSAGTAGSGGATGCATDADCLSALPGTTPAGCAEAWCDATGATCRFRARDADLDGHRADTCVSSDTARPIDVGDDCDDDDGDSHPGGWDGPADGAELDHCADGIDQNCSGADGDMVATSGATCECAPDATSACSETEAGIPITWPGGTPHPASACRFGTKTCAVDPVTGRAAWGACIGAVAPTTESCNALDDDCDGELDEPDAADAVTWYYDYDQDGFCVTGTSEVGCNDPDGTGNQWKSACSGDEAPFCAGVSDPDADGATYPGASEVCDGKDNDCDGSTDENVPLGPFCDAGTGACYQTGQRLCINGAYQGCSVSGGSPTTEYCDGADNDCDGSTDETGLLWYYDGDRDTACRGGAEYDRCSSPNGGDPGWVTSCPGGTSDCYDGNGSVQYNGQPCSKTDGTGATCSGTWSCGSWGASCSAANNACGYGGAQGGWYCNDYGKSSSSCCIVTDSEGEYASWSVTWPSTNTEFARFGDGIGVGGPAGFTGFYFEADVRASASGCCETNNWKVVLRFECVDGSAALDVYANQVTAGGSHLGLWCSTQTGVRAIALDRANYCCCGCLRYIENVRISHAYDVCTP